MLRAFSVVWALLGVAFVLTPSRSGRAPPSWPHIPGAVSLVSLVIVAVTPWSSQVGVVIDIALVAVAVRSGAQRGAGAVR